ncbi:MAG: patatin-like phospholipase family protein [Polyangiales bacterium]
MSDEKKCVICSIGGDAAAARWAELADGDTTTVCRGACFRRYKRKTTKRALVLSGGGTFGAFQAGALCALTEAGLDWDLIVGTSAGALNGAFMAQAPVEKQRLRAYELLQFWRSFTSNQVYTTNVGAVLREVLRDVLRLPLSGSPSLLDTAPLRATIASNIMKPAAVELKVVATNIATGEARVVDSTETTDMTSWVLASGSVPVLFPPVEIDGQLWVDGGVRRNDPVEEAIRAGANEIDVILCTPLNPSLRPLGRPPSLFEIAERAIMDVREGFSNGDAVEWRNSKLARVRVLAPTTLPDMGILTFDHGKLELLIEHGAQLAKEMLVRESIGIPEGDAKPAKLDARS